MGYRRGMRLGFGGALLVVLVTSGLFSRVSFVRAAACSISADTTIDQSYITTNSCATISITGTTTITWSGTTDLVGDGTVTVESGTVTFSGAVVLGATDVMTIANGATVTHAVTNATGVNITAASLTVTGNINANSKGCQQTGAGGNDGFGPNGSNVCTITTAGFGDGGNSASTAYQGGGHGGAGGLGSGTGFNAGGGTYDSATSPVLLGSSGGAADPNVGGTGGGLIRLTISNTLTVNGVISANGGNGTTGGGGTAGGGGSGGAINISTAVLAGSTGTFTANGGNGGDNTFDGGGGGGGRIALTYASSTFSGLGSEDFSVSAGTATGTGVAGTLGTVYTENTGTSAVVIYYGFTYATDYSKTTWTVDANATNQYCSVSSDTSPSVTATTLGLAGTIACSDAALVSLNFSASSSFSLASNTSITVNQAAATVDFNIPAGNNQTWSGFAFTGGAAGPALFTVNDAVAITLTGNSTIMANTSWTNLTNLTIDSGSSINANAKGCLQTGTGGNDGFGPNGSNVCVITTAGYGDGGNSATSGYQGAGHGGAGGLGTSTGFNAGGVTYGSLTAPSLIGSSGGAADPSKAGTGGGRIRLSTTGTLTLNGSLSANASAGIAGNNGTVGGGGSGGSVYITATTIAGATGTVTASGGAGGSNDPHYGGGGGGGRVAFEYAANTSSFFSGLSAATVAAGGSGPAGAADGNNGTLNLLQFSVPTTPSLSAPTNGTSNNSINPTLTGSTYSSDGAAHTSSTWKITTDIGGGTVVWSKDADTTNLTSIVVNTTNGTFSGALSGATALANSTTYYAFVRYTNAAGNSSWSAASSFTTASANTTSTLNINFTDVSSYTAGSSVEVTGGVGRTIDVGGGVYGTPAPAALSAWTRRKALTVTNNVATAFTNLQAKFTVTYDGDMQADFDDLRFTNASGTALDYWIESQTNSVSAIVWVEVDSISSSGAATVYMYYGNGAATAGSNGTNTFIKFDDFDDNSLNGTLWATKNTDANRTVSETSSALTVAANTSATANWWTGDDSAPQIYTAVPGSGDWSAEVTVTAYTDNGSTHGGIAAIEHWSNAGKTYTFGRYNGGTAGRSAIESLGTTINNAIVTASLPVRYRVRLNGTTKYYDYSTDGGVNWTSAHNTTSNTIGYIALFGKEWGSSAMSVTFDNFFIRNNASTEPSVSTGAEVSLVAESAVSIVNTTALTATYTELGTFVETLGAGNAGTIYYQMSKDGTNWKYWNGSNWAAASTGNYNAASVVSAYLPQFVTDIGKGKIYAKAFLIGSGSYAAVDNIAITYAPLTVALSTATQSIAESGGVVTVTAQLNSTFSSDVVVPFTVSGTATGGGTDHNLANGNITVTAGATTGAVTFSVINDVIDENNETVIVTLGAANYGDLSGVTEQTITITDNDTASISLVESASATEVKEGDYTDTYTIVLGTQPASSVTVAIASTMSEATPSPTPLTFTTGNWNTPQTVTVTAVNDSDVETSQSDTFTHTVTSSDPMYNGFSVASVSVAIVDNDHRSSSSPADPVLTATKTITVVSPVSGTRVAGGGTVNVAWNYTGVIPNATVSLSTDGGSTWTIMKLNIVNAGSTSFAVSSTATTSAVVKVEGTDLATTLATGTSVAFEITGAATTEAASSDDTSSESDSSLPSNIAIHDLVKLADDGDTNTQVDSAVYYIGTDLMRHAFPNASVYFTWYANFDDVETVSATDLAALTLGKNVTYKPGVKMVRFQSSSKVYAVDLFGVLRWVVDEPTAVELYGSAWNTNIDLISDAFFANYSFGLDINGVEDLDPNGFEDVTNPSDSMAS